MKELTKEVLFAYAAYDAKLISDSGHQIDLVASMIDDEASITNVHDYKLQLYGLDMLTKEIEHGGETFVPIDHIDAHHNFSILTTGNLISDPTRYPYTVVQWLISLHFNVFDLDPSLWVDKSTIK